MKIQPLADRIVVQPLEAEEVTSGGIVLPDNAKDKPQEGKVLAVGPGKKSDSGETISLEVKAGDIVLYGKYSGTDVKTKDGDNVLIMREEDVLAIVK